VQNIGSMELKYETWKENNKVIVQDHTLDTLKVMGIHHLFMPHWEPSSKKFSYAQIVQLTFLRTLLI